jgi:hypothetical protein
MVALKFMIICLVALTVGLFIGFNIEMFSGPTPSEVYMKACSDAGGIPVIVARGSNVCINPGAVIKDMGND